jgi:hypothetical protein
MKKLIKPILLILLFVALIFFQRDAVMPFVYDVIKSDLFLVESDDLGDTQAIANSMTSYAHQHCNQNLREEYGDDYTLTLSENAINIWDIGNHDYVVNGEITVQSEDMPNSIRKYVCRIKHSDDSPSDFDNWSLYGISGLDDL